MRKIKIPFTKILFFLGLFLITAAGVYLYRIYNNVVVENPNTETGTPSPSPTPDPLRIRNILLLGYAGGDHDGATLTDTIILVRIYPLENKVKLISIPRDIWVLLPIAKNSAQSFKVNHAFAIGLDDKKYPDKEGQFQGLYGAGTMAREAVFLITGIMPENFVAINFEGFMAVVNNLGGVTVNVPFSFEDIYYPIKGLEDDICGKSDEEMEALHATLSGQLLEKEFPCRYETLTFTKGNIVMDGDTALKFVRSRHSDINGSDFGRSLRQQAFLVAIKNRLLKLGSISKIIPTLTTLSKNVITDIDIKTALSILNDQDSLTDIKIETLSLTTDNVLMESTSPDRQYILIPKDGIGNWKGIHQFINENM